MPESRTKWSNTTMLTVGDLIHEFPHQADICCSVLTKVVVYSGIGMLACGLIPVLFEVLGWGL